MAGAGEAAFQLGQYRTSRRYLQLAIQEGSQDLRVSQLLKTAEIVLEVDPTSRGLPETERRRRLADAFSQAEQRLQSCAQQHGEDLAPQPSSARSSPLQLLQADWLAMKSKFRARSFRVDIATADDALDLVFRIEQETQAECGPAQGKDLVLLLISRARESER